MNWLCEKKGYAVTYIWSWGKRRTVKMHRLIMQPNAIQQVDHKDGNPLNNQRDNLRLCAPIGNAANARKRADNSSGFKGVSWNKTVKRWYVKVGRSGRHLKIKAFIKTFDDPISAAKAYDEAALARYGEFAKTNKMLGLL